MATNKIVHGNFESEWGISEESTFGTAIADAGTFVTLDGPIPNVDPGTFQDQEIRHGDGRVSSSSHTYNTQIGGTRVIPFSNLKVHKTYLPDLLYLVLQNVSEAAGTPYEKTYTLNHATTQPDFSSNAGYFVTVGIYDTIASFHRKYTSCILKSLTLNFDLTAGNDMRLMASGEFISGFTQSTTTNFSGTWAHAAESYFNFGTPTKYQVGSDAVIYGADVTIINNAVRIGHDTTGQCETYALGQYDITGNVKVKYDANTQGAIAAFIAGTDQTIKIATGTDGADGNFDMTFTTAQYNGNPEKDYGMAEGQAISLPFRALGVSGDATNMADITCSDAVDRAW